MVRSARTARRGDSRAECAAARLFMREPLQVFSGLFIMWGPRLPLWAARADIRIPPPRRPHCLGTPLYSPLLSSWESTLNVLDSSLCCHPHPGSRVESMDLNRTISLAQTFLCRTESRLLCSLRFGLIMLYILGFKSFGSYLTRFCPDQLSSKGCTSNWVHY